MGDLYQVVVLPMGDLYRDLMFDSLQEAVTHGPLNKGFVKGLTEQCAQIGFFFFMPPAPAPGSPLARKACTQRAAAVTAGAARCLGPAPGCSHPLLACRLAGGARRCRIWLSPKATDGTSRRSAGAPPKGSGWHENATWGAMHAAGAMHRPQPPWTGMPAGSEGAADSCRVPDGLTGARASRRGRHRGGGKGVGERVRGHCSVQPCRRQGMWAGAWGGERLTCHWGCSLAHCRRVAVRLASLGGASQRLCLHGAAARRRLAGHCRWTAPRIDLPNSRQTDLAGAVRAVSAAALAAAAACALFAPRFSEGAAHRMCAGLQQSGALSQL